MPTVTLSSFYVKKLKDCAVETQRMCKAMRAFVENTYGIPPALFGFLSAE